MTDMQDFLHDVPKLLILFALACLDVFGLSRFNVPLAIAGFFALSWLSSLVLE
jgi:hypothetical protein